MSILDNLKNLVVEQVEVPDAPKLNTQTILNNIASVNLDNTSTTKPVDDAAIKSLDEKIKSKLDTAILAKSPKFYKKLTDLLSTLAEDMGSEDKVYKMAIKLLTKEGATPDLLTNDINLCMSAIEDNNKVFTESVAKKLNDQISSRQNTIASIEQNIAQKNQQLQLLQVNIASLSAQKDQESNLINVETQKTNISKDRYAIVYGNLHSQLEATKTKISNYSK
jgi:hypothetical protein